MAAAGIFGTELPIIQAPMAGVQTNALAVAVCRAGGLGSLPCAMLTPATLRSELQALSAGVSGPYNVNFFCHESPVPDEGREQRWRKLLAPYYAELGISTHETPSGPARSPFDARALELLREFRPRVVSFHFGLPAPDLLEPLRAWGAKILSSATTVAEAQWLEARGVDAVIAQGIEAGGHRGHFLTPDLTVQLSTLTLVPQIARKVRVPVIASGGIADERGVAAALALGASAAQIGTAFLLCPEATTSAPHRAALASEASSHTAVTNLFSGRPARGIVNRLMREHGPLRDDIPEFPLASTALAPLRAAAERRGSGDFSPMWSGQNAGGCRPIPAGQLVRQLAASRAGDTLRA
ncbi:MAG TPA: nitronate monooxygenase [Steroidobacteraceae bacterium]|nr:nitronate monooxygenase [Steroidobacteraceae bacterium]